MGLNLEIILLLFVLMSPHKLLAETSNLDEFAPALATWYGDANGAGSGNYIIYVHPTFCILSNGQYSCILV